EREHEFAPVRDLPADQPGVAALRNEWRARLVGELEDRRDLRHRPWAEHRGRAPVIKPTHLDQIRLLFSRLGDQIFAADDVAEAGEEGGIEITCGLREGNG